jgi:hypothetical protein
MLHLGSPCADALVDKPHSCMPSRRTDMLPRVNDRVLLFFSDVRRSGESVPESYP